MKLEKKIAEILPCFDSLQKENILIQMINDDDELVRANVCDSLSFSTSEKTLRLLFNKLNDTCYLVRGYSILSIADIQIKISKRCDDIIEKFEKMLKTEENEWVKIALYRSIYQLNGMYFDSFFKGLQSDNYQVKLFTINLMKSSEKINDFKKITIVTKLKNIMQNEKEYAVKESIASFIEQIDI